MSFSKVSDTEVLKQYFLELCRQEKQTKFSLLMAGKTGVGKSSLVNALVGKQVAGEGFDKRPRTNEVTLYEFEIEGVRIRVWDSPGLRDDDDDDDDVDGTGNDEKNLAEIKSKIKEELDLVILCLKMDDTRFHRDDKETFKILTTNFGKELWQNAVIALTFADKVEDPAKGDREAFFSKDLANWREAINLFLTNKLKLDPELVQSLPLVPTGYYRPISALPNGGNWLSNFWIACYSVARTSAAFNLYRINRGRVTYPGSEKMAAFCDGSEVAPPCGLYAGDFEIIPIYLDEEQQESFWKKTWEVFKEYCLSAGVVLGVPPWALQFLKP